MLELCRVPRVNDLSLSWHCNIILEQEIMENSRVMEPSVRSGGLKGPCSANCLAAGSVPGHV